MKVIIVSPFPFPGNTIHGGVEAVTVNLLKGLSNFPEVKVRVLAFYHNERLTHAAADNITIEYYKRKYNSRKLDILFYARHILRKEADTWQPDIIHIEGNGTSMLYYNKDYCKRMIITPHGVLNEEKKYSMNMNTYMNYMIAGLFERWFSKKFINYIFISEYIRKVFSHLDFSKINYRMIFNPLDDAFFCCPSISTSNSQFYFVGRLSIRKGIKDLVEAIRLDANNHKHSRFFLIGGFDTVSFEREIKNKIEANNLQDIIILEGWKSSEEVRSLSKKCCCLILPSHQETLPISVAEAMASGKIVIATQVGGIPEMIEEGKTGFLFEPGNTSQLASLIVKVSMMEKDEIAAMQFRAYERAKEMFDPKSVAAKTIDFYQDVCKFAKL